MIDELEISLQFSLPSNNTVASQRTKKTTNKMDNDISSEGLIQSSSGNDRNALITVINSSLIFRSDENKTFS